MDPDQKELEFLRDFIVQSDAIENIHDDKALLLQQLEDGEVRGHVGALLGLHELAHTQTELTHAMVKQTQSLIVAEQALKGHPQIAPKYLGEWRDVYVSISGRNAMPPQLIPAAMVTHIYRVVRWQKMHHTLTREENIRTIARFHFEYEHIHPFIDGNGRSGRALVYYLYKFVGLPPFIFTSGDRHHTYYRCFAEPKKMEEYFLDRT